MSKVSYRASCPYLYLINYFIIYVSKHYVFSFELQGSAQLWQHCDKTSWTLSTSIQTAPKHSHSKLLSIFAVSVPFMEAPKTPLPTASARPGKLQDTETPTATMQTMKTKFASAEAKLAAREAAQLAAYKAAQAAKAASKATAKAAKKASKACKSTTKEATKPKQVIGSAGAADTSSSAADEAGASRKKKKKRARDPNRPKRPKTGMCTCTRI